MYDQHVVPTNDLAAFMAPRIEQLDKSLDADFAGRNSGRADQGNGAIQIIAERAALTLSRAWQQPVSTEATVRRFWAIRAGEQLSVGLTIAEAFVMAVDENISETDIPILVTSVAAARESVDAFCRNLGPKKKDRLAKQLYSFSKAYLEASADPETHQRIALSNAKRRALKRGMPLYDLLHTEAMEYLAEQETEREEELVAA